MIPGAIKKDERLTAIGNGIGIPLLMSLHLWVSSPWIPATIAAVAMNLTYIEAALKVKVNAMSATASTDGAKANQFLRTEVTVSMIMIGMALWGYFSATASHMWIIAAILLHGLWDLTKHTCGVGVPFFGWYLSACAIFDVVYAAILFRYVQFR
mmetsp:Transcript_34568/g.75681  ORF Transcript_34568/g.75681 Transcript_34568/m.75681 type:complete len:154 (-) Transcript_34568:350-811(-)